MFGNKNPKPVAITLLENTGIDGHHVPAGTTLLDVDGDLAVELAGQGKARLATDEEVAKASE